MLNVLGVVLFMVGLLVSIGLRTFLRAARPDKPAEQARERPCCATTHQTPSAVGAFGACGS